MRKMKYTKKEWDKVTILAEKIVCAANKELELVARRKLLRYIRKLVLLYGEDADLLATAADFYSYNSPAVKLLEKAYLFALKVHDWKNLTLISGSITSRLLSMRNMNFEEGARWLKIFKRNLKKYSDQEVLDEYKFCCFLLEDKRRCNIQGENLL